MGGGGWDMLVCATADGGGRMERHLSVPAAALPPSPTPCRILPPPPLPLRHPTPPSSLLAQEWPLALALLAGLLAAKITIISALGPLFGLTRAESVRTGFVLSQGGEFAFVLLALANQLNVLPAELNRLLIIVVVLSMALTPLLTEVGGQLAARIAAPSGGDGTLLGRVWVCGRGRLEGGGWEAGAWSVACLAGWLVGYLPLDAPPVCTHLPLHFAALYSNEGYNMEDPVVILSFGDVGQVRSGGWWAGRDGRRQGLAHFGR